MNIIHAHIKVKPEYRDQFLEYVKDLVKESQAEEGNISYQLFEDTSQANHFVMLEEWKDESAIEYHFSTPHFKEFGKISSEFLQEAPSVKKFEVTSK